jgi:uncharacterized NAD(P)/FAD-binding protein YdhS
MTEIRSLPPRTIAIVGAGFSGTLCAVNLLRLNRQHNLHITLVEKNSRHGRGLAYRTWDDNLVLNVPAGNMSALADDPTHFVQYCQSIDPAFNSGSFVSRRIYGDYLEWTLQQEIEARPDIIFERMQADVRALRGGYGDSEYRIEFADGAYMNARRVVLALGHFAPQDPGHFQDFYRSRFYIGNPWDFPALDKAGDGKPIALLGAAHTALDVLFRLTSQSDARKVYLISRRGLPLQPHRQHPQSPPVSGFPSFFEGLQPSMRNYMRALRQRAQQHMEQGSDWRDVINSIRAHTNDIWQRLPLRERRRFLSHVVAYWDIHRHRLAPVAHLRLQQMIKSGQVETIAGYVQGYEIDADVVNIAIRERGSSKLRHLQAGHVVNCTGPNYDIRAVTMPLVAQLRDEGYLLQDALKLGFDVNERYQVLNAQGSAARDLYYIGPMLKARYWEAIAVPELRVHARRLAEILSE